MRLEEEAARIAEEPLDQPVLAYPVLHNEVEVFLGERPIRMLLDELPCGVLQIPSGALTQSGPGGLADRLR